MVLSRIESVLKENYQNNNERLTDQKSSKIMYSEWVFQQNDPTATRTSENLKKTWNP